MPIVSDMLKSAPRVRIIGELLKSDGFGGGDGSPGMDELDVVQQLGQCNATLRATTEKYANLYSRMVGALSPQAKASADVLGMKLRKEIATLEDASIRWQKHLISIRKQRSTTLAKRGFDDARADLATLRSHMDVINSGTLRVAPEVRRRLVAALGIAEERVRLSA